jgi:hypothetical protein
MMVMWASHAGEDDASGIGVTDYLCAPVVWKAVGESGRERVERTPPPEILRGDPELMRWAISAVPFDRKYASVVLSFAREDVDVAAFNAGDAKLRRRIAGIMRAFEEAAFAGVPIEHRPPALWTTHTHTGRLELNACFPRAVLNGQGLLRSINPHPPGAESQKLWDAFRDVLNCRFGWADPEDPARARLVSVPNWVEKIASEARRAGKETRTHVAQHVAAYVHEAVARGQVTSRDDLIAKFREQGLAISRIGRDYITLVNEAGARIRLRGRAFSEEFTSPEALPQNQPWKKPRLDLEECKARLAQHLERRAVFNLRRYGGPQWQPLKDQGLTEISPVARILGVATPPSLRSPLPDEPEFGPAEIAVTEPAGTRRASYKALLFLSLFGDSLPDDLVLALRWIDRARRTIWLRDGSSVVDHGERITATKATSTAVRLMVAEARAKGWRCITLTGSDPFKHLAAEEAAKLGIAVSNPELRNIYPLMTQKEVGQ